MCSTNFILKNFHHFWVLAIMTVLLAVIDSDPMNLDHNLQLYYLTDNIFDKRYYMYVLKWLFQIWYKYIPK